jgi:hypothetical protein
LSVVTSVGTSVGTAVESVVAKVVSTVTVALSVVAVASPFPVPQAANTSAEAKTNMIFFMVILFLINE